MSATAAPPGPAGPELVRTLLAYTADPFSTLTRLARKYGDVVRFIRGPVSAFLINEPRAIERVLVDDDWNFVPLRPFTVNRAMRQGLFTSQGQFHAHQRLLLAPLHEQSAINRFGESIAAAGTRCSDAWQDGQELDIEQEMVRLSVLVSAELLFGRDATTYAPDLVAPALPVNAYLGTRSTNPVSGAAEVLPVLPGNRSFWQALTRLDGALLSLIRERRSRPAEAPDLVGALLAVRDTRDGQGLSDAQVRDEALALYTTGNAVIASAMLWTWYLLSEHGEVDAMLCSELDTVLAGRPPTAEDLPRLNYARMVVAESMRLFPPAWTIGRRAVQDYTVDGYLLPAGLLIVLSPYVTQRDERFFPQSNVFDPERWSATATSVRPAFSYFPFSGGSRSCLGEHLAWMELVLSIAALRQRGRLRLIPDHALALRPLIALRPKGGMQMRWAPTPAASAPAHAAR